MQVVHAGVVHVHHQNQYPVYTTGGIQRLAKTLELGSLGTSKLSSSVALKFSIPKLPSPQAPLQTIYNIVGKKHFYELKKSMHHHS